MKQIQILFAAGFMLMTSCSPTPTPTPVVTPPVTPGSTTDSSYMTVNYSGNSYTVDRSLIKNNLIGSPTNNGDNTSVIISGTLPNKVSINITATKGGNQVPGTYYYPTDSAATGYGGIVSGNVNDVPTSTNYTLNEKKSQVVVTRHDATYIGGTYSLNTFSGSTVVMVTGTFLIGLK